MRRSLIFAFTTLSMGSAALAAESAPHPAALDDLIAHYATMHGIPARLVHRVIARESGYNAHVVHLKFYGLMQITYQSARSMGYTGAPEGLLDPAVNLTYAVPYLANAYKAAGGNETGAVRLYASGYYYEAKRKHLLGADAHGRFALARRVVRALTRRPVRWRSDGRPRTPGPPAGADNPSHARHCAPWPQTAFPSSAADPCGRRARQRSRRRRNR